MSKLVDIREIIEAGGSVEGDQGSKGTQDIQILRSGDKRTLYPNKSSAPEIKNNYSVSLNKDTGNVKISAPSSFFSTQSYQEKIKPALETMSQNYKLDPEYKYALLNNENDVKTTEDWIKEVEKELPKLVSDALNIQAIKDETKAKTGLDLTDEQVIKMSSVAIERQDENGQVIQVTDDTIQSLPELIKNMAAFKNLQGWQNGEVTYKNLMESWNRENTPDEDLLQVYDTVAEYLNKGEFDDADEYAEMVAFAQFIEGKHPETGFWRGAWDIISDTFYNAWAGTAKFDVDVLNALEGALNVSGTAGSSLAKGEWTGEPATGELNFVRDYLMPELEDQVNKFQTNSMKLNEVAGTVGAVTYTLTPLLMQLGVGLALGKAAAAGVSSAAAKMIAGTGEAGLIGVAEGMTAEQVATSVVNGTNFLMRIMSANKANGIVASAVGVLKAAQTSTAIAASAADLAAQIVVDVTISDSKLMRQLLDGDVSNDVKEYVLEQVALDAGGWAIAIGSIEAVKGVSKTDLAKVVNAAAVPRINKWASNLGEYTDTIKVNLLHGGDPNWNQTKADRLRADLQALQPEGWKRNWLENRIGGAERRQQNLMVRRVERLGREAVGKIGRVTDNANSWSDIVENANRIRRESDEYFSAAHGLANRIYKNDVSARVSRIKNDVPALRSALDEYVTQLKKVVRAEDAASLRRGSQVIDVGDGKIISMISKESNEYAIGLYRLRLGEDTLAQYKKEGRDIRGVQQEIEYYSNATKKFREKYPALAAELDRLELTGRNLSAATEEARVYAGVLDEQTLLTRRGSPYFRRGYMRTQRMQDWLNPGRRGDELRINNIRDDQHLKWGFEGDAPKEYQDMTFVLFDDINQVAKQSIRKEEIGYLEKLGEKVEVTVDGERVYKAKEATYARQKAVGTIENTTNNAVKELDPLLFNNIFNFKRAKSKIGTAKSAARKQGAKVAQVSTKIPKVTKADREAFVKLLDRQNLDDLVVLDQTSPFAAAVNTEEDFENFLNSLDKKTKQYLLDSFDEQADYLFQRVLTKEEQLAQLPVFDEKSWLKATGDKKVPAWAKKYVDKKNGQTVEDLSQIDELKNSIKSIKEAPETTHYTLENFEKLVDNNNNFLPELKRQYVLNNKNIMGDDRLAEVVAKVKQRAAIFDAETLYADNIRALEKIKSEYNLKDMAVNLNEQMDEIIDGFIATNRADETTMRGLRALTDDDDPSNIVAYATLKSLTSKDNLKKVSSKIEAAANKEYNEMLTVTNTVTKNGKKKDKISKSQIDKTARQWAKQTAEWYEERVNQRFGQIANVLREEKSDVLDYKDLFGKIDAINKEITDGAKSYEIVKTYDDIGREEYVRLSPTVARLITTMPTPMRRGAFGTLQQEFVQVFRMGTTGGMVPASLIRQWFRDSGLAVTAGNMTRTTAEIEEQLTKVWGSTIADYYEKDMPDLWDTLLSRAEETGEDVERLAVQNEMERAKTYAPDTLQSRTYQFNRENRLARNQDGIYDKAQLRGFQNRLENFMMKTEKLNNIRETNRRVWVYQNAYLEALRNGHSVPSARRYAEMIQAEATTNFSRQLYHFANLSHSVPYLGAAINGWKSFWRLMAMDPMGITTRIVGGYLIPLIALTNISINDPENKEVYKQIPEYEKDDNLVFVLNGQKFSIPIPQEVSALLRPIQSMIELMQGANDHSAEELMANDLAGLFPYELQGFINADADRILSDDVFENVVQNHLLPGFSMLSSQMMPPLIKSGVMMATGYDPYTRKKIDTSYTVTDPETGESIVVDYKSGELAKLIGNIFGDNVSAQMAQAVLNNLLGSGNMNIIDGLSEIGAAIPTDEGIGAGLTAAAKRFSENASKPLYIPTYGEESNLAWRRAVNQLYSEKEALLNDKEYLADLEALRKGGLTEEAENKIKSRISTKREEFQDRVLKATQNLMKEYDGTLDRNKFASVISLMTFYDSNTQDPTNPLEAEQNKEGYKLARAKAVETMARMGFTSPNDRSIFGYYAINEDTGEIAVQFNSPLAILDYEGSSGLQSDIALANIKAAVNADKLWDAHDSIAEQIDNLYSSGKKLSNSDRAKKEAIQINWNAQVAKTIAPYVSKMTPEAAINNTEVRNYLYPLIEVPDSWEVNNKGRGVSLGERGNKKRAYYDSWIKSMFSVNDPYKGQY